MNPLFKRPAFLLMTGLLVFSVLCPCTIHATEPFAKIGTTVGTGVLTIPRGVRNLSLGGIGAADPFSPDNVYYNPAVAFVLSGVHFTTNHSDFYADIEYSDYNLYSGYTLSINSTWDFRFGGGIRYTEQKVKTSIERTVFLPEGTGRTFSWQDSYYAFVLGCGLSVGGFDFGAGLSVKPVTLELGSLKENFETYDIGAFAQRTFEFDSGARLIPSFGISVLNLGSEVDRGDYMGTLPEHFRVGAGVRFESPPSEQAAGRLHNSRPIVSISAIAEYLERRWYTDDREGAALGLETSILDIVFLRVCHADNTLYKDGGAYGFGLGWQYRMVRLRYDYARVPLGGYLEKDHVSAHGGTVIVDF